MRVKLWALVVAGILTASAPAHSGSVLIPPQDISSDAVDPEVFGLPDQCPPAQGLTPELPALTPPQSSLPSWFTLVSTASDPLVSASSPQAYQLPAEPLRVPLAQPNILIDITEYAPTSQDADDVRSAIVRYLNRHGYQARSYYPLQGGFAIRTPSERVLPSGGVPPDTSRWAQSLKPCRSMTDYFQRLFRGDPGIYRELLFVVTEASANSSSPRGRTGAGRDEVSRQDWAARGGRLQLYIYESRMIEGTKTPLRPSTLALPLQTHLSSLDLGSLGQNP